MENILISIAKWYAFQCDGKWEKSNGVQLDTVSEGGWWLKIDLKPEIFKRITKIPDIRRGIDEYPEAWIHFSVSDSVFVGSCAPLELPNLISIFLEIVDLDDDTKSTG